jgi:hypothetical protein
MTIISRAAKMKTIEEVDFEKTEDISSDHATP